jgi:hypothetical protein
MTMRRSGKTITMTITISMLAIVVATPLTAMIAQEAAAAPTNSTITRTIGYNTTGTASSGLDLSQQPVLQERVKTESETAIDYAHTSITYSGNGTLTLPINNIVTMANFTSNGSALISFVTQSAQGTETIRTERGETATITFYEIVEFNPATTEGKGIIIANVHTNPTGALASLNGMTLAGIDEILSNGQSNVTFWKWESGISNLEILPVQDELIPRPTQ